MSPEKSCDFRVTGSRPLVHPRLWQGRFYNTSIYTRVYRRIIKILKCDFFRLYQQQLFCYVVSLAIEVVLDAAISILLNSGNFTKRLRLCYHRLSLENLNLKTFCSCLPCVKSHVRDLFWETLFVLVGWNISSSF